MGRRVVRQPNGLFAIFSSICDDFVLMDGTQEDILEELVFRDGFNADLRALDLAVADEGRWGSAPQDGLNRWRKCLSTIEAVHNAKPEILAERIKMGTAPVDKPVPPPGGNVWGLAKIEWVHGERDNPEGPAPMRLTESQWLHWKGPDQDKASAWSVLLHFRKHDLVTRKSEAWFSFMVEAAEPHLQADTTFELYSPHREVVCRAVVSNVYRQAQKAALDKAVRAVADDCDCRGPSHRKECRHWTLPL